MTYDENFNAREGGSFFTGFFAGALLGAGVALLFAPRPGAETRRRVSESASQLKHAATETYSASSEKVARAVERGKDAYQKARNLASHGRDELGEAGREASHHASEAVEAIRQGVQDVTSERPRFS